MKWYFPSMNGDFRIERADDACVLSVVAPTPHEVEVLKSFLAFCREKGWTDATEPPKEGEPLRIAARIEEVGGHFLQATRPQDRTLTAIVSSGGEVKVVEGATRVSVEEIAEKLAPDPDAVVSVRRPTPCCPSCVPGAVEPASEVLRAFMTPEQHADWAELRAITVHGNLSGHRYLIAHRHTPLARRFGRICWDADDKIVMHFHDVGVPPEEEVLAAKLILEHREDWLRNEATCFGGHRYKNPFGSGLDGVSEAIQMSGVGRILKGVEAGLRLAASMEEGR